MEKTWMPVTGGILSLICGAVNIIGGIVLVIMGAVSGVVTRYAPDLPPAILMVIFILIGLFILIIGIIALVGGIYALRRKVWGMALAGSIASFFSSFWWMGIAAIVFISLSRKEFE